MTAEMSASSPTRPSERSSLMVWMAWRRYLTTVRSADAQTYEIVEESAWQRLDEELAAAVHPSRLSQPFVPTA